MKSKINILIIMISALILAIFIVVLKYKEDKFSMINAIANQDKNKMEKLLKKGVPIDQRQYGGGTGLYNSIIGGCDSNFVEYLLIKGANPNATNLTGETPLSIAVGLKQYLIVEKMLRHGGNPSQKNNFGQSSFDKAEGDDRMKNILKTVKKPEKKF